MRDKPAFLSKYIYRLVDTTDGISGSGSDDRCDIVGGEHKGAAGRRKPNRQNSEGANKGGCLMFSLCFVFAIIAMVSDVSGWWIAALIYAIIAIIMFKVGSKRESGSGMTGRPDLDESKEVSDFQSDRCEPLREVYPLSKEGAYNLFKYLQELDKNEEMRKVLAQLEMNDTSNSMDLSEDSVVNRIFPTLDNRLAFLALTDIIKCYEKLCKTDKIELRPECMPLAMLLTLVGRGDTYIWDEFNLITETHFEIAQGYYNIVKNGFSVTDIGDKLYIVELLRSSEVDEELANRYAVLLYRFSMIIANADGSITPSEKEWLTTLLSFTKPTEKENVVEKSGATGDALKELSSLIGLSSVKREVENIYNLIKIQRVREEKGLKSSNISYHCVFTGNPGTGKTTVARLVAQIYRDLGILSKGHLVETDRSGLVAEYVGQTAVKTNKIIDSALDGVLFIDEAYSLVQGGQNDFGMEAISTLLKRMEDDRDRLVVILAGYSDEMKQFIDANPGLQSRFNRYIHFEDYDADELVEIYSFNLKKYDYRLSEDGMTKLREALTAAVANKDKNFGNARYIRNLFEKTIENQARRLASVSDLSEDILVEIKPEDIPDSNVSFQGTGS